MASSEKKVEANRRNALKSTGPRTAEGKRRSAGNATKHGLTAKSVGLDEGPVSEEVAERERAWGRELNASGSAIGEDLVRLAVCAYGRARRGLRADEAEAARRLRDADANWVRERAARTVVDVADLKVNPAVAVKRLEGTVGGCDWMIETWKGLHAAMDGQLWKPPYHEKSRQLLGHDESDPAAVRLPDVWQEAIELYMTHWRARETPIALLPWHERVLTVEGLVIATQKGRDILWELYEHAQPMCEQYKALMLSEIARLQAVREALLPLEESDRAAAPERALLDGSDAGRLRLRYIGESQRDLLRLLKELREVDKHAEKFPPETSASEAETVAPLAETDPAEPRNEANAAQAPEAPDLPADAVADPIVRVRPKNPPGRKRKKR